MYTNNDIIKTFEDATGEIAEFISKLNDFKMKFGWISNQTLDNADPELEASECLEKLGVLLATLIIYKNEYKKEPIDEKTGKITYENE